MVLLSALLITIVLLVMFVMTWGNASLVELPAVVADRIFPVRAKPTAKFTVESAKTIFAFLVLPILNAEQGMFVPPELAPIRTPVAAAAVVVFPEADARLLTIVLKAKAV